MWVCRIRLGWTKRYRPTFEAVSGAISRLCGLIQVLFPRRRNRLARHWCGREPYQRGTAEHDAHRTWFCYDKTSCRLYTLSLWHQLIGTKILTGSAVNAVMEMARSKGIAVEVCPISSQILALVADLRNHPTSELFTNEFPLVVSLSFFQYILFTIDNHLILFRFIWLNLCFICKTKLDFERWPSAVQRSYWFELGFVYGLRRSRWTSGRFENIEATCHQFHTVRTVELIN